MTKLPIGTITLTGKRGMAVIDHDFIFSTHASQAKCHPIMVTMMKRKRVIMVVIMLVTTFALGLKRAKINSTLICLPRDWT